MRAIAASARSRPLLLLTARDGSALVVLPLKEPVGKTSQHDRISCPVVIVPVPGTGPKLQPAGAAALPSKDKWQADVRMAMSGSHRYVGRRVAKGGRRLAVNFDIDNTTLATHYAAGKPVARVLHFAEFARRHGVRLLFNTARPQGDGRLRKAKRQLERASYRVAEICGRRQGERLAQGKRRCRKHFVNEGYTLIMNVGNRKTDFVGGNYEKAFRLANYHNRLS